LEVAKKIDTLTLGLPKIACLVGWQYSGHDSKYPSWDVVNERLKRPEDATAPAVLPNNFYGFCSAATRYGPETAPENSGP